MSKSHPVKHVKQAWMHETMPGAYNFTLDQQRLSSDGFKPSPLPN